MKNYIISNQTSQTEALNGEGDTSNYRLLPDCVPGSDPSSFSTPVFTLGILQIQHEVLLNTHISINIYFHRFWFQCLELFVSKNPSDSHSLRTTFVLHIRGNYFKMHIVTQGSTLPKLA